MRAEAVREEVTRLIRAVPFRPFVMTLENGEHVTIAHPENIAFDPTQDGQHEIYVLTRPLNIFSTLDAVTSVTKLDAATPLNNNQ